MCSAGGQTPILSSLELYDELQRQLPDFLHNLTTKGVFSPYYRPQDGLLTHVRNNWSSVLSCSKYRRGEKNWMELEGKP